MKKKQNRSVSTVAMAVTDLDTSIHSHAEFFDHLVELIPARFYSQNDDIEKPYIPGLSKTARASLKKQTKKNLKLARRQKFDPDHKPDAPISEEGDEDVEPIDGAEEDNKEKLESVTYEGLRQKLRMKIESLRGNRGEGRPEDRKRRRDWVEERNEEKELKEDEEEAEEIIEYGKVRLGDDEDKKKKRKLSKSKELEMAKKLQEEKKEKPFVAEKESWSKATERAMGVKVHDDARLIKESIKKEKKRKEKNAEKWKERVDTQVKMKEERQKKRRDNIVGRINEKKSRRIAKREKKLMRPGFEGRKEGFITKD